MKTLVRSYLAACVLLTAACGDDGGGVTEPVCPEQSGIACVWLGQTGNEGYNGDGHHRLDTAIYWSMDMLFTADGTAWFIDWNNHLLRKVRADQTVETVVGWNDPIFPGDGTGEPGDAGERSAEGAEGLAIKLNHPTELVEAPDGAVMMMAWHNHKLRRIDPATGRVRIIAGAGAGYAGDGGALAPTLFRQPKALTRDAAGSYYIGDQANFRIRKITGDQISLVAGNGMRGPLGDGGLAVEAQLNWEAGSNPEPSGGLAVADGKLYVSDTLSNKIRVIDLATGMISAFAGTGAEGYAGDGGPAAAATLRAPRELEIGPDGHLYVADTDNSVIRAIDLATSVIRTVAGTGELGADAEDGKPALETKLRRPFGLEFDRDGNLYIMDTMNSRIVKVAR